MRPSRWHTSSLKLLQRHTNRRPARRPANAPMPGPEQPPTQLLKPGTGHFEAPPVVVVRDTIETMDIPGAQNERRGGAKPVRDIFWRLVRNRQFSDSITNSGHASRRRRRNAVQRGGIPGNLVRPVHGARAELRD